MKELVLTEENIQQVADELEGYDILMSVLRKEDSELGKEFGTGLFDLGFGKPASTFYPADGTVTFKIDEKNGKVSCIKSNKHD